MIGCKGLNFKFVICNPCYSSLSSTILPPFWFILSPLESICFNKLFKCFIPVKGDPLTTFNCVAPVITECSNTFEASVTYWSNAMDILLTSSLSLARLPELGLLVSSLYFFGSQWRRGTEIEVSSPMIQSRSKWTFHSGLQCTNHSAAAHRFKAFISLKSLFIEINHAGSLCSLLISMILFSQRYLLSIRGPSSYPS